MKIRLTINLSPEHQQQLECVKAALQDDAMFRAVGGQMNDNVALRYVLFSALESHSVPKKTPVGQTFGPYKPTLEIEEPLEPEEVPAPVKAAEEEPVKPLEPAMYDRPFDWQFSDEGLWDFPDSQREMHAYYDEHGWMRVAAQLDDRVLQFYWTPKTSEQKLPAFSGRDGFNRTISVQKSPDVGVAHMIPEDWDEPRGATGDIGMWSPGG